MEITLTPELEAEITKRAAQQGMGAGEFAAQVLAGEMDLAKTLDESEQEHADSKPLYEVMSRLWADQAQRAPAKDLSHVYGSWGRAGYPVDGLEYEREMREEGLSGTERHAVWHNGAEQIPNRKVRC